MNPSLSSHRTSRTVWGNKAPAFETVANRSFMLAGFEFIYYLYTALEKEEEL